MPKFIVTATATAYIEETWEVEAASAEEAEERFYDSASSLTFISDRTIGEEENREIVSVEAKED